MSIRTPLLLAALTSLLSCTQVADTPRPAPAQTPGAEKTLPPAATPPPTQTSVPAPIPVAAPIAVPTKPSVQTPAAQPQAPSVQAPSPKAPSGQASSGKPKVLILGDSQISFGAGGPLTAFFGSLGSRCTNSPARLHNANADAIGVRSTALHHWTTRAESERKSLCAVDPKFGVNAGAYGVTSKNRTFVQIGKDPAYPFCPAGRPALEAAITTQQPDLLVLSFLGNAQERWQTPAVARADWAATERLIPTGTACMVVTSLPSFNPDTNTKRQRAQSNLASAVTGSGRCTFVPGFTARTRAAFEGNTSYFRTNAAGDITDPNHPTERSAQAFIDLQTPALCAAIAQASTN